jgi:hypothetical protein
MVVQGRERIMNRFAKLLVVTFGFGALGFVVSLVQQRSATGAASAPVTVTNTSVNPVPMLAIDNPGRHSFTVTAACNLFTLATPTACSPENLLEVESGQIAVVREINANCTGTAPLAGFVSLSFSSGTSVAYDFAMDASVPNFLFLDKETSLFLVPVAGRPNTVSVAFAADSLPSEFSSCNVTVIGNFVNR